jgi:UDP-N-acetylmuramate dehydrogenase
MDLAIKRNELLAKYTTLKIGGPAAYLVRVSSVAELTAACRFAQEHTDTPPLLLGGGSNVLCSDVGYDGLVIINNLKGYEIVAETTTTVDIEVGAGEVFDDIVARTVQDGYWGLENLSAIPGSVGATPIQNVGAYGVEIDSVIVSVTAVHRETLEEKIFTPAECQFAYRDSFFKSVAGKAWCVTQVVYRLSQEPTPNLTYKDLAPLAQQSDVAQVAIREAVIHIRSQKFPDWRRVGTAGSFFKNPIIPTRQYEELQTLFPKLPGFAVGEDSVKVPLGWLLDKVCDLKGYQSGAVRLYENQALVLVAEAGATATAVESFVSEIRMVVHQKTGLMIEREVLSV